LKNNISFSLRQESVLIREVGEEEPRNNAERYCDSTLDDLYEEIVSGAHREIIECDSQISRPIQVFRNAHQGASIHMQK
jgi:hypothetical protein